MSPPHPLSYRETFKLCSLMYPRITRTVPGTCVKKWNFIEWISDCPTQHPRCFYHPGFLPPSACPFFKLESTQHSFSQPLTLWLLLLRLAAEISWRKSQRPTKASSTKSHCWTHVWLHSWLTISVGFPGGSGVKNPPTKQETGVQSLGQEDPLEKGTATHSSVVPWRIPWTEEPGGLQSMGSQKSWVRLSNSATIFAFISCCLPSKFHTVMSQNKLPFVSV